MHHASVVGSAVIAILGGTTVAIAQVAPPSDTAVADRVNDVVFSFDVAAGNAAEVLANIAAQANIALSIDRGGDAMQFPSRGVRGRHTVREAIDLALAGTGRHAAFNGTTIRLSSEMAGAQDDEIVVIARPVDFLKETSSLALRTQTSIHDTPGRINAVTDATLKSQNAFNLTEALRNIPGVAVINGNLTGTTAIFGPDQNSTVFLDGMRVNAFSQNEPTIALESIEVLKGPASLLTGTSVAGGTINYVPKRAAGTSPTLISLGIGSGGEVQGGFDVGGAISRSNGLFYRAIGFSQTADHLVDGGSGPHSISLSGMFGYRSNHTRFDVIGTINDDRLVDQNFYYFNVVTGKIVPWGSSINRDGSREIRTRRVAGNFEQDIVSNDDFVLKFRSRAKYETVEADVQTQFPGFISGNNQFQALVPRFLRDGYATVDSYARSYTSTSLSGYADIYARFKTGPLEHQFLVAGDYYKDKTTQLQFSTTPSTLVGQTPDLLALDGSTVYPIAAAVLPRRFLISSTQKGLIIQDLIEIGPLHLVGAGRFSWYEDYNRETIRGLINNVTSQRKFLASGGAVLDITKPLAVYFNYSASFSPRSSAFQAADGTVIPPTIRKQIEAGFKWDVPGRRLAINASAFSYVTNNSAVLSGLYYTTGPGQRAKGVELSAIGRIVPNLDLTAGYTYTVGRFKDGRLLYQAPEHVANLWMLRTIPLGARQAFTVGIGGNYQSGIIGYNNAAAFLRLPTTVNVDRPFFSVNGALGYRIDKTRLNLTVDNILNRFNIQTPYFLSALQSSTPRRFRLVMTQQF